MKPRKIIIELESNPYASGVYIYKIKFNNKYIMRVGHFGIKSVKEYEFAFNNAYFIGISKEEILGIANSHILKHDLTITEQNKTNIYTYKYGRIFCNGKLFENTRYYINHKSYDWEQFCEYFEPGSSKKYNLYFNIMKLKGILI